MSDQDIDMRSIDDDDGDDGDLNTPGVSVWKPVDDISDRPPQDPPVVFDDDKRIARRASGGVVTIFCPGCKSAHGVRVEGPGAWTWNGSLDRPTFSPSVLVTGVRDAFGPNFDATPTRCHSFVRDGRIEFLSDCTHDLAGQTVALNAF